MAIDTYDVPLVSIPVLAFKPNIVQLCLMVCKQCLEEDHSIVVDKLMWKLWLGSIIMILNSQLRVSGCVYVCVYHGSKLQPYFVSCHVSEEW